MVKSPLYILTHTEKAIAGGLKDKVIPVRHSFQLELDHSGAFQLS